MRKIRTNAYMMSKSLPNIYPLSVEYLFRQFCLKLSRSLDTKRKIRILHVTKRILAEVIVNNIRNGSYFELLEELLDVIDAIKIWPGGE